MIDIKEIKPLLKRNIATVTFNKKDGTERVMKCTLREDILDDAPATKGTSNRKVNDEVLAVWDMELSAWRSFRYDSVTHVSLS